MKVTSSSRSSIDMDYQNYFEAFVGNKSNYKSEEEEEVDKGSLSQALSYMIFLFSPVIFVILAAVGKRL